MKILKYILLLSVLTLIASMVFVATLKPDYNYKNSIIVNYSNTEVFDYINDYKNWSSFASVNNNEIKTSVTFSKNTSGKGASYNWKTHKEQGKLKTIFTKKYDSIHQKLIFNDVESDLFWIFNKQNGKTKVTLVNKGKMNFIDKISNAIFGTTTNTFHKDYLINLTKVKMRSEPVIDKFSIFEDGFIETPMGVHLQKTINSTNANVDKNIQIMIANLKKYTDFNKIAVNGKPFVKYNATNEKNQTTNFSVCISVKDSINTATNSEYIIANMLPFQAMKTTLTGNLSHKFEARSKAVELATKNNLIQKNELPVVEVYVINKLNSKNTNDWITEIYVPIKKKDYYKNNTKPQRDIKSISEKTIDSKNKASEIKQNPEPIIPEKIIIKKDFPQ